MLATAFSAPAIRFPGNLNIAAVFISKKMLNIWLSQNPYTCVEMCVLPEDVLRMKAKKKTGDGQGYAQICLYVHT